MTPRAYRLGRMIAVGTTAIGCVAFIGAATVIAGDRSYVRVVDRLRTEYRASEQSLYGAGVLGELAVAFMRPAGVSKAKFTILRDLAVRDGRGVDFNRIVRSAVESTWRPLVRRTSPAEGEWTYVYAQPDGKYIRLLVINRARSDAVVVEVRVDPDKLSAFVDHPEILGIPLPASVTPRYGAAVNAAP